MLNFKEKTYLCTIIKTKIIVYDLDLQTDYHTFPPMIVTQAYSTANLIITIVL